MLVTKQFWFLLSSGSQWETVRLPTFLNYIFLFHRIYDIIFIFWVDYTFKRGNIMLPLVRIDAV